MDKLHKRLEDVLSSLYDYEYIDLDKFYNDNGDLLEILNKVDYRGYAKREEMECLQELYDNLNNFIKFESNYNSSIEHF